jgi:hypothetical protein
MSRWKVRKAEKPQKDYGGGVVVGTQKMQQRGSMAVWTVVATAESAWFPRRPRLARWLPLARVVLQ